MRVAIELAIEKGMKKLGGFVELVFGWRNVLVETQTEFVRLLGCRRNSFYFSFKFKSKLKIFSYFVKIGIIIGPFSD